MENFQFFKQRRAMNKKPFYSILATCLPLLICLLVVIFYNCQTRIEGDASAIGSIPCVLTFAGLSILLFLLIYFFLRLRNITHSIDNKLELSRQQLKSALDAVGDAAWHYHVGTGHIICNKNYYTMLGHEPDAFEMTFEKVCDLTHPEDQERLKQITTDYIDGKIDTLQIDFRLKAHEDQWIWLLSRGKTVERDEEGRALKIAGTSIDITEEKEAKNLLRASEERYRLVVENMDEYIFIVCNAKIVFATPNLVQLIQPPLTMAQLLKCVAPGTQDQDPSPQTSMETVPNHAAMELICGTKDKIRITNGQKRWMESHSTPVLWKEHPAQLVCWRDITDRVVAEEREKQLEHYLFQTQKMSALASMANSISRQYKNYMQIIGGNVELALSAAHPSEEYYTQLKKIESVVAKATELMNMFAAFSNHEAPSSEIIDLNTTLKELYPTLQCIIPKNITLRYFLKAENQIQATQTIEIGQSIMNLVLNACEAMPEGGEIVLYSHDILPRGAKDHSSPYVGLDIIDQGHGIPKNIMPRIFDPFFTTKDKDRHLGLGLYTTYTMITGCGGFIECKKVLCGTRFKLWFPAKISSGKIAKIISFPVGGNETILLVDDNHDINVTTVDYLRRFGYNVIPMYCAEEALHFYEKAGDTIDLVIMDLVMPGMGGIEGIKKLHEINPKIKIIVASAYVDDIFTDSDAQTLVSGVIHKPYLGGGVILNIIRKVLD